MQKNKTEEKAKRLLEGDAYAFVNPEEWQAYNLWCIDNLERMIKEEEREQK